jgi:hypothetical protein
MTCGGLGLPRLASAILVGDAEAPLQALAVAISALLPNTNAVRVQAGF